MFSKGRFRILIHPTLQSISSHLAKVVLQAECHILSVYMSFFFSELKRGIGSVNCICTKQFANTPISISCSLLYVIKMFILILMLSFLQVFVTHLKASFRTSFKFNIIHKLALRNVGTERLWRIFAVKKLKRTQCTFSKHRWPR